VTETTTNSTETSDDQVSYDRGALTYSGTFDDPFKRNAIRTIEWVTGKIWIIKMIREFERMPHQTGQAFWRACLDVMRIELQTPQEQLENIPAEGPTVLVANHPHGLVDGMVLADLIGRRRDDYRILTRSILTGIDEDATNYMIPVPFPHEPNAQKKMVEMRKKAMNHLKEGGLIALFPSGVVASSETMFGPVIEKEWNPFTAKMIRTSGACVVPLFFQGANSRLYQIANQISATLRQGLLLHEIVHSTGKPQAPIIGEAIPYDDMTELMPKQREFMAWLRDRTLNLGKV